MTFEWQPRGVEQNILSKMNDLFKTLDELFYSFFADCMDHFPAAFQENLKKILLKGMSVLHSHGIYT